ncbi:MAG: hypothetical protein R2867_40565 [Caldilineaceae bacterium]
MAGQWLAAQPPEQQLAQRYPWAAKHLTRWLRWKQGQRGAGRYAVAL